MAIDMPDSYRSDQRATAKFHRRHIFAVLAAFLLLTMDLLLDKEVFSAPSLPPRHDGLVDQDGAAASLGRWRGRIVVLNFFYTLCTTACPIDMLALEHIRRSIPSPVRSRVEFVSISIDPDRDDPAILRAYARSRSDDLSNWAFLSGPSDDIRTLMTRFAVVRKGDTGVSRHATAFWLLDPIGRVVQKYAGLPVDSGRIAREIVELDNVEQRFSDAIPDIR